jgi:hypothetical protein
MEQGTAISDIRIVTHAPKGCPQTRLRSGTVGAPGSLYVCVGSNAEVGGLLRVRPLYLTKQPN